jgi:hypothetical protein
MMEAESTKDDGKPVVGQALSDIPALKPYWGKPAVRNFRGGDGNIGIIRSPVRAIALPDYRKGKQRIHPGLESCRRHREVSLEA